MFSLIWSIIVGFFVGLIARWIVPGADHYGFIGTLFNKPAPGQKFHTAGFLMSIVGAVILLFLLRFIEH
jgi:uncharacterized membrane protein YeaQ/YmgE (transglycosylase-associated protein family)